MAVTPEGAYYPTFPQEPIISTAGFGELRFGVGAPASDLGTIGDGYISTSNGNFYVRRTAGWLLVSGGGGGGISQVIAAAQANPNSPLVVLDDQGQGGIYTQDGTGLTNMWRWDVTAQVWEQLIG